MHKYIQDEAQMLTDIFKAVGVGLDAEMLSLVGAGGSWVAPLPGPGALCAQSLQGSLQSQHQTKPLLFAFFSKSKVAFRFLSR